MNETPKLEPIIILASGSPRRRQLLEEAGYDFRVVPPSVDVECGVCSESGPAGLVADLAYRKATAVLQQVLSDPERTFEGPRCIIVAADTVAECDGFILGKPRDEDDAHAMLTSLSGREHRVYTGLCLLPLPMGAGRVAVNSPWRGGDASEQSHKQLLTIDQLETERILQVAITKLRMDELTTEQLDEYIQSGQWEGKAGAFGYQDRLGWVHIVEGGDSNVVGLPMELLADVLSNLGYKVPPGKAEH